MMYHHHSKFGYKRWSSSEDMFWTSSDMFWTSSDTWKDIQKDRQTVMPVHPPYSDSVSSTPSTQWFQYMLLNFVTGEQNTVAGDGSRSSKQVQTCEVRSRSNNNNTASRVLNSLSKKPPKPPFNVSFCRCRKMHQSLLLNACDNYLDKCVHGQGHTIQIM